ncbi:MAG TPA: aminotransferase class V-fold PLP-dependent enzyme [Devosia sp.]|nr:aminotransferase class V-fold PLP-dependent enzyme [Devosia sp.]
MGISGADVLGRLRAGLIGEGAEIDTPFGKKPLVYADYVASGRALSQVEDFVNRHVLPFYANTHTEASFCGAHTTRLREGARAIVASECNANADYSVIFTGPGATSAVNRLVALSGICEFAPGEASVFVGPYEHHSNILPWRESGAEIVEIDEAGHGGVDLVMLKAALMAREGRPLLVGSFSAASNVAGALSDVAAVSELLRRYGALSFWDYAGGGPYLEIDMEPNSERAKDAVFFSPHKFAGGPGASGILIVRKNIVRATKPTWPGGGSVSYVSPWDHDYLECITAREEAGTPNIIGDIRAGLAMLVKRVVGRNLIEERDRELGARALEVWNRTPGLRLLGAEKPDRLPIFSFLVARPETGYFHHHLITRMLSDVYGIQARGGCACAGPYGHRLLRVGKGYSEDLRQAIRDGEELKKPGWTRLNFSYLMDDETADFIVRSVAHLTEHASEYAGQYEGDAKSAQFCHCSELNNGVRQLAG